METKFNQQQLQAIESKSHDILISAGAGSGKSTVLVERVMRKIIGEEKLNINQFLIVTFTDLASKEMSEKLRKSLNEALVQNPEDPHLQQQLYVLPHAHISTFHGFCKKVLQRYYYLIGLDANLQVLEAIDADLMLAEVLNVFMDEAYEEEDFRFLSDVFGTDRHDVPLAELIMNVYERARANPEMENWLADLGGLYQIKGTKIDDWIYYDQVKKMIIPVLESSKGHILKARDIAERASGDHGYLEVYHEDLAVIDVIKDRLETGTYDEVRQMLSGTKLQSFPRKKKEWDEDFHKKAGKARDKFKAILNSVSEEFFAYTHESHLKHFAHGKKIVTILADVVTRFHERFAAEKLTLSKVDFSDLERLTLKILQENESVLQEIATDFKEIMIDEYQDTNGMQERIVKMLADAGDIGMFMVGDVKQSIYRFRLADPTIFQTKYAAFRRNETLAKSADSKNAEAFGEKIDLMQNYRSSLDVIDATNYIFRQIMDVAVGEIEYDEAAELKLGTSEASDPFNQPELYVIDAQRVIGEDKEKESLQQPELEAHFIAGKIRSMVETEAKIWDRSAGIHRPITYKDIVILLRTMTSSSDIYDILTAYDIPVSIESTGNLLEEMEIITIRSALRVIDNPYQDIPLVAIMRSPLFFFTEPELAKIRIQVQGETFYDALKQFCNDPVEPDLQLKVTDFLNKIESWRYVSRSGTVAELLRKLYEETSYYQFVYGMSEGLLRRANLDLFETTAVAYEQQTLKGLYGFLSYLDQLENLGKIIPKAKLLTGSSGVKIMSIHKSKGLEFPIVFVANLQKQFNTQDELGDDVIHTNLGLGVRYIDPVLRVKQNTLPTALIIKQLRNEMLAEEMRLLYVALTRSQSKLILTGVLKDEETILQLANEHVFPIHFRLEAKRYLDWLLPTINQQGANPWKWEIITELTTKPEHEKSVSTTPKIAPQIDLAAIFNLTYNKIELTTITAKQSVTQRKVEETLPLYQGISEALPPPAYDRPSFMTSNAKATEIGTAFHQFMQHVPVEHHHTLESLTELKNELIWRHILHPQLAEHLDLTAVLNFTNSKLYSELQTAHAIQKELPFTMLFEAGSAAESKAMLQGIVDLLAEFEQEVWIIDYKTDQVVNFTTQKTELKRRYDIQMKYYLQAMKDIYPAKKVLAKVFFMRVGEYIEYS